MAGIVQDVMAPQSGAISFDDYLKASGYHSVYDNEGGSTRWMSDEGQSFVPGDSESGPSKLEEQYANYSQGWNANLPDGRPAWGTNGPPLNGLGGGPTPMTPDGQNLIIGMDPSAWLKSAQFAKSVSPYDKNSDIFSYDDKYGQLVKASAAGPILQELGERKKAESGKDVWNSSLPFTLALSAMAAPLFASIGAAGGLGATLSAPAGVDAASMAALPNLAGSAAGTLTGSAIADQAIVKGAMGLASGNPQGAITGAASAFIPSIGDIGGTVSEAGGEVAVSAGEQAVLDTAREWTELPAAGDATDYPTFDAPTVDPQVAGDAVDYPTFEPSTAPAAPTTVDTPPPTPDTPSSTTTPGVSEAPQPSQTEQLKNALVSETPAPPQGGMFDNLDKMDPDPLGTSPADYATIPKGTGNDPTSIAQSVLDWAKNNEKLAAALVTGGLVAGGGLISGIGTAALNKSAAEDKVKLELEAKKSLAAFLTSASTANAYKGPALIRPAANRQPLQRLTGGDVYSSTGLINSVRRA